MANIRQASLLDLIPNNLKNDPQVAAAAEALNIELQAVTAAIDETILLARLDELPESVVDSLAWQWHVDFYDPNMALVKKRALLRQSIAWHKRKGTPGIVQDMVSAVFSDGKVYEWWEYGGEPYRFRVECTDLIQDGTILTKLGELITAVKNTRSWCDAIQVRREKQGIMFMGFAAHVGKTTTIYPATYDLEKVDHAVYYGLAYRLTSYVTINPLEV